MKLKPAAIQKCCSQLCNPKRQLKNSHPLEGNGMGPDIMSCLPRESALEQRFSKSWCSFADCLSITSLAPACTIIFLTEGWRSRSFGRRRTKSLTLPSLSEYVMASGSLIFLTIESPSTRSCGTRANVEEPQQLTCHRYFEDNAFQGMPTANID